jgi:hypothetical protein
LYHSIIIGQIDTSENTKDTFVGKNTWADWYLIPSSRPVINPPEPKTNYIDIPGGDGYLDLSTVLTGDIAYNSRQGSLEFIVDNGFLSDYKASNWSKLYSQIMDYLHGKLLKMTLEDDPSFYYEGRLSVNSWKSDEHNSKITIDYTVSPYKFEAFSSLEDWKWDSFNFESSIIRDYRNLKVNGSLRMVIIGRRMSVTPTFIVKSDDGLGLNVAFNGTAYHLDDGVSRVVNIRTGPGDNSFMFTGHGTVSIDYRGGCL